MGLFDILLEDKGDKTPKKENKVSFPKKSENVFEEKTKPYVEPVFTSPKVSIPNNNLSCEPFIEPIVQLYEKGFDNLNQNGYDFYEYYKSILSAGENSPAIYKMALTMAKGMDSSVTKEKLSSQADFYLKEITKVYDDYISQGSDKKRQLEEQKTQETQALKNELQGIESQLIQLNIKKGQLESDLGSIDNRYSSEINEISCKLKANDVAKDKIFKSINEVKQGINSNL